MRPLEADINGDGDALLPFSGNDMSQGQYYSTWGTRGYDGPPRSEAARGVTLIVFRKHLAQPSDRLRCHEPS